MATVSDSVTRINFIKSQIASLNPEINDIPIEPVIQKIQPENIPKKYTITHKKRKRRSQAITNEEASVPIEMINNFKIQKIKDTDPHSQNNENGPNLNNVPSVFGWGATPPLNSTVEQPSQRIDGASNPSQPVFDWGATPPLNSPYEQKSRSTNEAKGNQPTLGWGATPTRNDSETDHISKSENSNYSQARYVDQNHNHHNKDGFVELGWGATPPPKPRTENNLNNDFQDRSAKEEPRNYYHRRQQSRHNDNRNLSGNFNRSRCGSSDRSATPHYAKESRSRNTSNRSFSNHRTEQMPLQLGWGATPPRNGSLDAGSKSEVNSASQNEGGKISFGWGATPPLIVDSNHSRQASGNSFETNSSPMSQRNSENKSNYNAGIRLKYDDSKVSDNQRNEAKEIKVPKTDFGWGATP
eukprot:NODE_407_length_7978_cov_0.670009.p3 type:complete len:412 gc:universal NODE_407_length_7978_cov_0.670009:6801-5566(-)